jgi:hypothetical protein
MVRPAVVANDGVGRPDRWQTLNCCHRARIANRGEQQLRRRRGYKAGKQRAIILALGSIIWTVETRGRMAAGPLTVSWLLSTAARVTRERGLIRSTGGLQCGSKIAAPD